ncbi:MAG: HEAT repeat domain-containing protein [Aquabacterium sp.]|nr:HEAT repeat domain-containing protein [Aquabacterium sp.]
MQASRIDSESVALAAIWQGTLLLCGMSVIAMIMVTVRRMHIQKRDLMTAKRKDELIRCFHAFLNSGFVFTKASLPTITPGHYPLILRIALDITRSLKGDELQRVVELLNLWEVLPYLLNTVKNGSRGKRIQALSMLSHYRDAASYQALLENAEHADMYIQMAALRGLAMRAQPQDVPAIVDKVIRAKGEMRNSLMLSDILRQFGEQIVPDLIKLVRSDAQLEVCLGGVMALGAIGSSDAVDTLIELAEEEGPLRARAIASMASIGDERAAYAIAAQLESDNVEVRIQAVMALGKMKILGTLPDLAVRLADDNWWVRFRAAEALYLLGDVGIATLMALTKQNNQAGLIAQQVLDEYTGGT